VNVLLVWFYFCLQLFLIKILYKYRQIQQLILKSIYRWFESNIFLRRKISLVGKAIQKNCLVLER